MEVKNDDFLLRLELNNHTATILKVKSKKEKVFIPHSIIYDKQEFIITKINGKAFEYSCGLKIIEFSEYSAITSFEPLLISVTIIQINIPKSVIELKEGWCKKAFHLNRVLISPENKIFGYLDEDHQLIGGKSDPKNENFDQLLFACRDIETAVIPSTIKYICSYSFRDCQYLRTIKFSEDSQLISIGKSVFLQCYFLKHLSLPATVKELCSKSLKSIKLIEMNISPKNPYFKHIDSDRMLIGRKSDPDNDYYEDIVYASIDITNAVIPSTIKRIKSYSFAGCRYLHELIFSEFSELISIEPNAFFYSGIKSLFITSNVKELRDGWCSGMDNLEKVEISPENKNFHREGNLILGKSDPSSDLFDVIVFANKKAKVISIPTNIKHIQSFVFAYGTTRIINLSKKSLLQTIGKEAFKNSNIDKIFIPKYVKKIRARTFANTYNLKYIEFDEDSELITIEKSAFNGSGIVEISFPKHLKEIGFQPFFLCKQLKTIHFPEDSEITSFDHFISSVANLETLVFPPSLKKLKIDWCFSTPNLKNIIIPQSNTNFCYIDDEHKLIGGKSNYSKDCFDSIVFACKDVEHVVIPSSIKIIDSDSFADCIKLKTVKFEENSELISIGYDAFMNSSIEEIIGLPKHLQHIGFKSFSSCRSLRNLTFSEDSELQTIESLAFANCQFNTFYIPANVIELKDGWCSYTPQLNEITISPANKNYCYLDEEHKLIGGKSDKSSDCYDILVFSCRDVKNVNLPSSIKVISSFAFAECKQLKSIHISNDSQLVSIGGQAFSYSQITSIFIPRNVEVIKSQAFNFCLQLKNITFDDDSKLASIESSAFFDTNINSISIPRHVNEIAINGLTNRDLHCFEFLGDEVSVKRLWFGPYQNFLMMSFPNAHKVVICDAFKENSKCIFYINAGSQIII